MSSNIIKMLDIITNNNTQQNFHINRYKGSVMINFFS